MNAMKKLLAIALGMFAVSAMADVTLDGPTFITSNTTVSEKVTGSGYYVVQNGATLTLSGEGNDFTGGVIISNGIAQADASGAFGTGPIVEAGSATVRTIKLNAQNGVFNNSLTVRDAGNSSKDNPGLWAIKSATWGGPIALDQGMTSVGSQYIFFRSGVATTDTGITLTCTNTVNAGVGRITFSGYGNYSMKEAVTVGNAYFGASFNENGCVYLYSKENAIDTANIYGFDLSLQDENILRGTYMLFRWAASWGATGHGMVKLNGHDQEFRIISSGEVPTELFKGNDYACLFETASSRPCTITVNGRGYKNSSGNTYVRMSGPISLVVEKVEPIESGWSLYQTFSKRRQDVTNIVLRSGWIQAKEGATFPKTESLTVSGGKLNFILATNSFTNLKVIRHTGGTIGHEGKTETFLTPINCPKARYYASTGASLQIVDGVTNVVGRFYLDGEPMASGVYTKAELPGLMSSSGATGALEVRKGPGTALLLR